MQYQNQDPYKVAPEHDPGPTTFSNRGMTRNVNIVGNCPCQGRCPDCGPSGFTEPTQPCGCAPAPICPPCMIAKTMKQMHESARDNADADAVTQAKLQVESDLERRLFDQAAFYAQEAAREEDEARQSAIELQDHASKAQIFRNKLQRAEGQAKQIALNAINTITIHPPHESVGVPGLTVKAEGYKTVVNAQSIPQYQLSIHPTDSTGFNDQIAQEINEGIAFNEQPSKPEPEFVLDAPDNIDEAQLAQEVDASAKDGNADQQ